MLQLITSFPRSGSHLARQHFMSLTGNRCWVNHHPIKKEGSISCIRNPQESISSMITMELISSIEFKEPDLYNKKDQFNMFVNFKTKIWLENYKIFFEFLKLSNHILIKYDKLILDPQKTILEVLNIKNIKPLENPKPLEIPKDNLEKFYVVKSSGSEMYKDVFNLVANHIDEESISLYEKLAELSERGSYGTV